MIDPQEIRLLIADDDEEFRSSLVRRFQRRGYEVEQVGDGASALHLLNQREFDVLILDLVMPSMSGLEALKQIKEERHDCEVIVLTGQGTIQTAVQAMKLGAFDFLTKPFPLAELEVVVNRAYEHRQLRKENFQLKQILRRAAPQVRMIGQSPLMKEVFRLIEKAGPTDKAILIQGESGTGKELVAQALHRASLRRDRPLVVVNCAALPETLLESELFGHEKGAFTGAVSAKPGLFEVADGGTLFIDEIGELPGALQAKLLRALEDGSIRRIGSLKERRVNIRLLAATNRNLAKEVEEGRFREDLYYRINVMSLVLPPLRERKEDIPLLVDHFLGPPWQIEPAAMEAIMQYSWPGNVRQLINAIDRAKILADDHVIRLRDLPPEVVGHSPAASSTSPSAPTAAAGSLQLAEVQKNHVLQVLQREGWNKARAARALGISRRSLYRLLEKYDIRPPAASGQNGS